MTADLSAAQARRIFLAAQGLATRRPRGAVTPRQFRTYVERQGVLQLDSVNVFARAHYMPLFSRFGPYSQERLDEFLWGAPHGHSAHAFEHWGHEASVMPLDLLPAMHHRMVSSEGWKTEARERLDRERPGLLGQLQEEVEASGPLTAGQLEHLAPRTGPKGTWWDLGDAKTGLEYLFFTGGVAASRGRHFTRTYDGAERAWGLVPAPEGTWGLPPSAAEQVLFDRGLAAAGVGLPQDIADHFRLFSKGGSRAARAQACAQSAVERGLAQWVEVEGWDQPAVLSASAQDPGRATGAALLSPFDPVCWYRPRLERMFGVEYRIEIYTPAAKRQYGYYCLPFLLGDDVVARADLKADRKAGRLLVQAAWREPRTAPGARRRPDAVVASALAAELGVAAQWLSLGEIVVQLRGDLSAELAAAVAT